MSRTWSAIRVRALPFLVVIAFWIALLALIISDQFPTLIETLPEPSLKVTALLGDTFGAFSALMAAFAAVGAVMALSEQRRAVKRQMFVSTLIAMLERLQQTIADTDFFVVEKVVNADGTFDEKAVASQSGQSAFYEISQELRLYVTENFLPDMSDEAKKGLAILLYKGFYQDYKDDLGHFFRQLYHIVKYIDESDDDEAGRFLKIVRASLSNAQLLLLAYNSISGEGRIKFSELITRHSFLHNLSFEEDELGRIERSMIIERLTSKALISDTQKIDELNPAYIEREKQNTLAKEHLRNFLNSRGLSINYGIRWMN